MVLKHTNCESRTEKTTMTAVMYTKACYICFCRMYGSQLSVHYECINFQVYIHILI